MISSMAKRKMGFQRRAQVTIFIILAVVIVVGIVGYFILRNVSDGGSSISGESEKLELVQSQVRPVYSYIDADLGDIVQNGLEILRLQGGYIYIPEDVPTVDIQTNGRHILKEGDNIRIVEGSGRTKAPVWIGTDYLAVPSLRFMEKELETYIQNELVKLSFEDFEEQGMILSLEEIKAYVLFEDHVTIELDYPVYISYKNEEFIFNEFLQIVNINYTEIYDVASSLAIYELGYNYLEYHAKSLMSLYAYAGGSKKSLSLPPRSFTEANTNCNFVTWNQQEVESNLKTIFANNFKFLKINGTNYERIVVEDSLAQGVYDSFIYDDLLPGKENVQVSLSYDPEHELNVLTNPRALIPDRVSQNKIPFLPSFCSFKYKFIYTVNAPIIFKILDEKSTKFTPEGYEFYFPIQMYICNDKARTCAEVLEYNLDIDAAEEAFDLKLYDCIDVDMERTIEVKSGATFLDDVDILHRCEGYDNDCWLGRTSNGRVTLNLPKCTDSKLFISKEGYQSIEDDLKNSYNLERLKDYNISVHLVDAAEFAEGYYLTDGFKNTACGKSANYYFEKSLHAVKNGDNALFSVTGDNLFFFTYPIDSSIKMASGDYNFNTIVQRDVIIYPSNISGQQFSFNNDDNSKPYEGNWVLGATSFDASILPSETSGKDDVTFYAMVEKANSDNLVVETFLYPLMTDDGLIGKVGVDSNCDGDKKLVSVNISKDDYINFIKPRFT